MLLQMALFRPLLFMPLIFFSWPPCLQPCCPSRLFTSHGYANSSPRRAGPRPPWTSQLADYLRLAGWSTCDSCCRAAGPPGGWCPCRKADPRCQISTLPQRNWKSDLLRDISNAGNQFTVLKIRPSETGLWVTSLPLQPCICQVTPPSLFGCFHGYCGSWGED